jgi:phosphate transport system substrate-binding protein
MKQPISIFFVPLAVLLLTSLSCQNNSTKEKLSTPTSGTVTIYSDESFKPVIDPLLSVFNALYPYATVSCNYQSETDAMNLFLKGKNSMIFATRKLTTAETDYFHSYQLFPAEIHFASDAIALIVHPNFTDSIISVTQIREILTGKISTWKQLGHLGSSDSIRLVFDNTGSGTVRFMIDSICHGEALSQNLSALKGNSEVIQYVSEHPNSIGVIGVGWISNGRDSTSRSFLGKIKVLRVSRSDRPTLADSYYPYQANLFPGLYPLLRPIYLINVEPHKGLASGMASFVCSDRGQRIILKTGILPAYETIRKVKIKE